MKILQDNWRSVTPDEHEDMEHAVPAKIHRASYATDGQLERAVERISELESMLGRLCDVLPLAPDQIEHILGHGFRVQP